MTRRQPAVPSQEASGIDEQGLGVPAQMRMDSVYGQRMSFDQTLPPMLAAASTLDDDDGEGVDFEPYPRFQDPAETQRWIRAWTGNKELDGAEYRIFGQDGTGGLVAVWLAHEGRAIEAQPVVFFGSEGAIGVVACNVGDYLWVLADGLGPAEVIQNAVVKMVKGPPKPRPNAEKTAFARQHAAGHEKPSAEVLRLASEAYPDFEERIIAQCR